MENVIRAEIKGKVEEIDPKYELLQGGEHQALPNSVGAEDGSEDSTRTYEPLNAAQIAWAEGGDRSSAGIL